MIKKLLNSILGSKNIIATAAAITTVVVHDTTAAVTTKKDVTMIVEVIQSMDIIIISVRKKAFSPAFLLAD